MIIYGVLTSRVGLGLAGFLTVSALAFLVTAASAGFAAAWLLPGIEDSQELRARRARQGLLAGAIAGAAGGLLITAAFMGLGFMMVLGPLAGVAGGAIGGAVAARYPRVLLPGGSSAAGAIVSGP